MEDLRNRELGLHLKEFQDRYLLVTYGNYPECLAVRAREFCSKAESWFRLLESCALCPSRCLVTYPRTLKEQTRMMEARGNSRHLESLTNAFRPLELRKAAKGPRHAVSGPLLGQHGVRQYYLVHGRTHSGARQ